ncbi:MAG: tyrosine-type recombinase/integrase, partial [Halomonadaceae bacterium]|nr:tyrosine-type recombinase/integrase [Halomonadaceae bacterium]
YVFPGRVEGKPITADAVTTAVMRLQGRKGKKRDTTAPLADLDDFTVHDLRRSFATGVAEHCGVQPHVIERMLNHVNEDPLIATYQRAGYAEEQRKAWQAWGELLASQVMNEPSNVVPMRWAK